MIKIIAVILVFVVPAAAHDGPAAHKYENTFAKDFIMDAPWRVIDESTPIPVTVIIKDCDVDDVRELHWIRVWDETAGDVILWNHDFDDEEIGDDASEHNFWTYITKVTEGHPWLADDTPLTPANLGYAAGDDIDLRVSIYYRDDWFNYTETRHLRVRVGGGPFPWPEDWYGGDVHYHTMYTNNIYEYGAPLPAVKQTAIAMGLHWLTATDHSCDLDETDDGTYSYATQQWEYTLQDVDGTYIGYRDVAAAGSSWNALGNDVAELDSPAFRLYRAVELNLASVDPATSDKTLHCLIYNQGYIHSPDSGAPGERPVSPDLYGALDQIAGDGFAYAAHPESDMSSEVLGLDFGINGAVWGDVNVAQALTRESFRGLQIFNTRITVESNDQNDPWADFDAGNAADDPYPGELLDGIELWDRHLRQDIASGQPRKLFIAGGSDAHGDFNYASHMSVDDYADDNAMGRVQTVAHVPGDWSPGNLPPMEQILAAYRAGRTVATDGPFLEIGVDMDDDGQWYEPDDLRIGDDGELPIGGGAPLRLRWRSLPGFGSIASVRLLAVDAAGTTQLLSHAPGATLDGQVIYDLSIPDFYGWVALRAELLCDDGAAGRRAYTNPIWIEWVDLAAVDGPAPALEPMLTVTPNPFNPVAEIAYTLTRPGEVRIELYDLAGRCVRRYAPGRMSAGRHVLDLDGTGLASGAYLCRLSGPDGVLDRKVSLVK